MSKKQRWIAALVAVVVVAGGLLLSTQTDLLQGRLKFNLKKVDKFEHQNVPNFDLKDLTKPKITSYWPYVDIEPEPTQGGDPIDGLTRCELAKMLLEGANIDIYIPRNAQTFSDVDTDSWCHDYAETVHANGIMHGYHDGTFGPANGVVRAELVKMVVEAFDIPNAEYTGTLPSDASSGWFKEYVSTLMHWDILSPMRAFYPGKDATQSYAQKLIDKAAGFGKIKPAYDTNKWPMPASR